MNINPLDLAFGDIDHELAVTRKILTSTVSIFFGDSEILNPLFI